MWVGSGLEGRAQPGGSERCTRSPPPRPVATDPALYPDRARGAGEQPGRLCDPRPPEPSERPASPGADLRGFLFPFSATVPFISGDGPQERKVTPRGLVGPGTAPSSFPGAFSSYPPPRSLPDVQAQWGVGVENDPEAGAPSPRPNIRLSGGP